MKIEENTESPIGDGTIAGLFLPHQEQEKLNSFLHTLQNKIIEVKGTENIDSTSESGPFSDLNRLALQLAFTEDREGFNVFLKWIGTTISANKQTGKSSE